MKNSTNTMLKLIVVILLTFSSCQKQEPHPTKQDWIIALTALYYNVDDICIREYGSISPLGVHYATKLVEGNQKKNQVNALVRNISDCYIDMVALFGVGENDLAPDSLMTDQIDYKEPIYTNLKNKILTQ